MILTRDAESALAPDHLPQDNAGGVSLGLIGQQQLRSLWTTDVVLKMSWGLTPMRSPRPDISPTGMDC